MNNLILCLLLTFYNLPGDTANYISFISYDKPKVTIESVISNSQDPCLGTPRESSIIIRGETVGFTKFDGLECKEVFIPHKYDVPFYHLKFWVIEISHKHQIYGDFICIAGTRKVYINDKFMGKYTFPIRELHRTTHGKLALETEHKNPAWPDCLFLTMYSEFMFASKYYEQKFPVVPGRRYQIEFDYCIPRGPIANEFQFGIAELNETKWLASRLKAPGNNIYHLNSKTPWFQHFTKSVVAGPLTTDIRISYDIVAEDIGDLIIKNFTLTECGNKGKP